MSSMRTPVPRCTNGPCHDAGQIDALDPKVDVAEVNPWMLRRVRSALGGGSDPP